MRPWTVVAAAVNSERLEENANTSDDVAAGFGTDYTEDAVMLSADVYDRDVKDIFAVEDEIAGAIAGSVMPMASQSAASRGARNN